MHAETPRLAVKTIIFSEHEVFEVVVMVTLNFVKDIFKIEKSPKNIFYFSYKIINFPKIYVRYIIIRYYT